MGYREHISDRSLYVPVFDNPVCVILIHFCLWHLATAWAVKVMENTCHATYFINKEKIVPVISEKETEPEQRGMIQQHRWA